MMGFELAEPRTLADAVRLLDREDPAVRPLGGGTALMLMMKSGLFRPRRLIILRSIEARWSSISAGSDGSMRIGAMATLAALERSSEVARHAPVVSRTLRTLSNIRVRNVATLGGHLAHGDPHMDLPPVLTALGASVLVASPRGERRVAVEDLFRGYLETALAPDELIAEVTVPPQGRRRAAYAKCTARSADDWPALGIAVAFGFEGGVVRDPRVVVGAATEKPTRLRSAEASLDGAPLEERALARAGEAAAGEAILVGDQHGSAAYKRALLRAHLGRALRAAAQAEAG